MADVTLADAIQLTRDRALMLATFALPNASGAYAYADQRSAYGQYFEFLLTGSTMTRPAADKQQWKMSADLRFNVGKFTQDYPGQIYQTAAFLYAPQAAQIFEQWRGLNDPLSPTSARVPYLAPDLTFISNWRTQTIDASLWVVFPWSLVYDTVFRRCGL